MNQEQEFETLSPVVIDKPYLMVTFIPCYLDGDGTIWLEQGWHHDLIEHLVYLRNFALCAPKIRKADQPNLRPMVIPEGVRFHYVELPSRASALQALSTLPRTLIVLWRVIGKADVVHSSVIGWPYPLGWIVNPFAVIRSKSLVIVVESSWRSASDSLLGRAWNKARELVACWSCKRAAIAFFTQPAYRDALYTGSPGRDYITPAVWINEADILSEVNAQHSWDQKNKHPVRMLFAGRLVEAKGVTVLLQALRILDERRIEARVDIIGEGGLRQDCLDAASRFSSVQLSVLDLVPYGEPFFDLVRGYDALLIPSLSDEQPRVVFDANAQAVPVIASDTPGLRPHIKDGQTGWLIEQGNPEGLAAAIEEAIANKQSLRSMGMASLSATRGHTHVAMHRHRSQVLKRHLSAD